MKLLALRSGPIVLLIAILLSASPGSAQERFHTIDLLGKTVRLPADRWEPMRNPASFAVNFLARQKADDEMFAQVVTVFKLPMQSDDRSGVEVAKGEYVEFFVVHPRITDPLIAESVRRAGGSTQAGLTMQVRLDRGGYWILSRQTFDVSKAADCSLAEGFDEPYRPFLSEDENRLLIASCDVLVKRTRFQLADLF